MGTLNFSHKAVLELFGRPTINKCYDQEKICKLIGRYEGKPVRHIYASIENIKIHKMLDSFLTVQLYA